MWSVGLDHRINIYRSYQKAIKTIISTSPTNKGNDGVSPYKTPSNF